MILVLIQLQKMEVSLPLLSKMQAMFFHFVDFVTLNLVRIFNRTEDYKIF